ncbi:MAG: DegT/DnrJ/EryC1/StrS family aminotransferase [Hyphomonadaceae bacterium]|nr:DegT/DnrJ/EryC1/StrS family aminotransferase [Hyphomonadaceae bacterium]
MADASHSPAAATALERFSVRAEDGLWVGVERALDNGFGVVFVTETGGKLLGQADLSDLRAAIREGRHLGEPRMSAFAKPFADNPGAVIAPVCNSGGKLVDVAIRAERAFTPVAEPDLTHREFRLLMDAFLSTWISSQGSELREFERRFAARMGHSEGVATSNGTVSLHLAMTALGIGPGDEVIVPDFTFAASANTVVHCGATPVLVDVDPETWCLAPETFEAAITPRTKAVMPVHVFGRVAPMAEIAKIAKARGIYVIEDCAEAHGAAYDGKPVGAWSDVASFSFFANKIITTGEGGMCITSDPALAARMRMLRDHGMRPERRYWHEEIGFNYRMTNLQAAIGLAQLDRLGDFLDNRAALEGAYRTAFAGIPGVKFPPPMQAPASPVTWFVCATVPADKRDALIAACKADNIDLRPFFNSLSAMPAYEPWAQACPVSRSIAASGINLPTSHKIDQALIGRMADIFRKILN